MKTCSECEISKDLSEFRFRKDRGSYYLNCKACEALYHKSYRKLNEDKLRATRTKWYISNKEKILSEKASRYQENKDEVVCNKRQYRLENKERLAAELKARRTNDLNFKLRLQLRDRLNKAIKNCQKVGSAVNDLGCTIEELKPYLEAKFKPGMTWDNWGKYGWHIDHIRPLSSFDLTDREQFLEACHYTNLQPMWAEDNLRKGNKYGV